MAAEKTDISKIAIVDAPTRPRGVIQPELDAARARLNDVLGALEFETAVAE